MLVATHSIAEKINFELLARLIGHTRAQSHAHFSIVSKNIQQVTRSNSRSAAHLKQLEIKAGWNPGKYDVKYLLRSGQVDLSARIEDDKPVAYMSLFKSEGFSFLGSLIAEPEVRGKGFGGDLWKHALDHATGRIGLYGTLPMIPPEMRQVFFITRQN
jgi:hypothetical protein